LPADGGVLVLFPGRAQNAVVAAASLAANRTPEHRKSNIRTSQIESLIG
jgi:hypothetical protein